MTVLLDVHPGSVAYKGRCMSILGFFIRAVLKNSSHTQLGVTTSMSDLLKVLEVVDIFT